MSKTHMQAGIAVAVGLAVVGGFFIVGNMFDASTFAMDTSLQGAAASMPQGDLVSQDSVVGTGEEAMAGDKVFVNYTGKFQNGTVFDTSVGKPPASGCDVGFCFTLGAGQVIQGWDLGVAGMKVGGKRVLIIGPNLGYGPNDYGPIPGGSTLVFEVELLKVQKTQ